MKATQREGRPVPNVMTNVHPALRQCWHPVARSTSVTDRPVRSVLMGKAYVLWRDANGRVAAFEDRCPHRLAPLSLGECEAGGIVCAYHGWKFNQEGRCIAIPALGSDANVPPKANLVSPYAATESHGMVFIAPEAPLADLPHVAEADDPSFMVGDLPELSVRGCAALYADNFLDMAHFPFVHRGTFGAEQAAEVEPYEVQRDAYATTVIFEHVFANREDPGVEQGSRPLIQRRRLTYRWDAPFHLSLRIDFLDSGGTNTIGFYLCPEDEETVRIYSSLYRDDLGGDEARLREAVEFEIAVIEEDLRIQTAYEHLEMPLDSTTEVHTRADRSTLAFRRVLSDLVKAAGY